MKRFPILGVLLLIPAIALLGAVGCEKKPAAPPAVAPPPAPTPAAGAKTEITTAPEATVKGVVKFMGTAPAPKVNPEIAKHDDAKKGFCGAEADQQEQMWIVGKDGGVANVIISLAPPSDKKFKKLDDKLLEAYKHPVVLDQPFCNYVPHVVALYAEFQPLVAKNEAKMNHNVKIEAGAERGGARDILVLSGKDTGPVSLAGGGETVVNVSCSIHTWMNAKVGVFNHPYFAVTDKDGKFEIKNVPIDTPLTVYMWHESNPSKVAQKELLTAKKGDNELKLEIGAK
jgi:hypothetical protein